MKSHNLLWEMEKPSLSNLCMRAKPTGYALAILTLMILATISSCASISGAASSQEPIKIGFIGPLTGNAVVVGIIEKRVIELAIEKINSEGGINGRLLEAIFEDGKCQGKEAATAASKLIEIDKVKILLVDCSSEVLAVAPISEKKGALLYTAYASHPTIATLGNLVLSNSYSDLDVGRAAAKEVMKSGRKAAVLYETTQYGLGLKDAFKQAFENQGGEVLEESFEVNSMDMRTQAQKIALAKPDAVFVDPDTPATGISALKQLREAGYTGPLFGNFFGSNKEVRGILESEGMVFFSDPPVPSGTQKDWLFNEYKTRYGEEPAFDYPAASRYDSMMILKQAIEKVGEDPAAIRKYIGQMEYSGILGAYRFNANGMRINATTGVKRIVDGEVEEVN